MSGGVDSSVAASMLVEQGHEVTGVTLKLWGGPSDSGCCSVADVEDARHVAAQLAIDHHVFNMGEEFEEHVVAPYVAAHAAGHTPNPCVECNRHLKFDALLEVSRRLGFEALATGHHAQVVRHDGVTELRRGADGAKDQSYVLSMLEQEQLSEILLPIGSMTKTDVRDHASARGLRTSNKAESQDTCFIESSGGRRRFLAERSTLHQGAIIEQATGRVVGSIDDLELVTVGQRQRLGVDENGERRVAVKIDIGRRAVLVASPADSLISEVAIDLGTTTATTGSLEDREAVLVQFRSHGEAVAGTLQGDRVILDTPINPVASGQTAAFYDPADPARVLGSALVRS